MLFKLLIVLKGSLVEFVGVGVVIALNDMNVAH